MNKDKDVTSQVEFGINEGELLPITKCVCGAEFRLWSFIIGMHPTPVYSCENCNRKMYFKPNIEVYEVVE